MSKKKGNFSMSLKGVEGETPQQTIERAERALAEAKEKVERQSALEHNPLVVEWKKLTNVSKTKPLSGGIKKKRTPKAKKKTFKTKKGAPKKKKRASKASKGQATTPVLTLY